MFLPLTGRVVISNISRGALGLFERFSKVKKLLCKIPSEDSYDDIQSHQRYATEQVRIGTEGNLGKIILEGGIEVSNPYETNGY